MINRRTEKLDQEATNRRPRKALEVRISGEAAASLQTRNAAMHSSLIGSIAVEWIALLVWVRNRKPEQNSVC